MIMQMLKVSSEHLDRYCFTICPRLNSECELLVPLNRCPHLPFDVPVYSQAEVADLRRQLHEKERVTGEMQQQTEVSRTT